MDLHDEMDDDAIALLPNPDLFALMDVDSDNTLEIPIPTDELPP
jgi:hypothetical protein